MKGGGTKVAFWGEGPARQLPEWLGMHGVRKYSEGKQVLQEQATLTGQEFDW